MNLPRINLSTLLKIAKEVEAREPKSKVTYTRLKNRSPVPVRIVPEAREMGGYYSPDSRDEHIGIPDKKALNALAHEISHADFQRTLPGQITQHPFSRGLHALGIFPNMLVGGLRQPGVSFKRNAAHLALLNAVLSGPTHASEAVANIGGYRHLKELGATEKELENYRNEALHAQGTYGTGTLLNMGFGLLSSARAGLLHSRPRYNFKIGAASEGQTQEKKEKGVDFHDLKVTIEHEKGTYRNWINPETGKQGKTLMKHPYGYIHNTEGMDGDEVDCYVGPHAKSNAVYVITTNKPPTFDREDEQKVMLGFGSAQDAKAAFHAHYDDPRFFREMRSFPYAEFRKKVLETQKGVAKIATTLLGGACE